jgi:hypothetical protein
MEGSMGGRRLGGRPGGYGANSAAAGAYGARFAPARTWSLGTTAELAGQAQSKRRALTVANQGGGGTEVVYLRMEVEDGDRPQSVADGGGSTNSFAIPNGESITVTGTGAWWIISDTAATQVSVVDEYD